MATDPFLAWLEQAHLPLARLTPQQQAVLQAAFRFRQRLGSDYYSTRLLGHFLLHCGCALKVAAIARLLGISRPTASTQQGLSSRQVVQQAHHRMDGRPYGKLLPRFAGPIAAFLLNHQEASRWDLIDFVERTFGVQVSRIALYKFLKKYGLDHLPGQPATASPLSAASVANEADPPGTAETPRAPVAGDLPEPVLMPPPFSSHERSSPVPSC
jgi:hypothetical protein